MKIPDEVTKAADEARVVSIMEGIATASPIFGRPEYQMVAEWARKEALREAAAFVKSEIERLELVKGTYAKAQRHSLGMVWGHIRADVLAEEVSDGQQ